MCSTCDGVVFLKLINEYIVSSKSACADAAESRGGSVSALICLSENDLVKSLQSSCTRLNRSSLHKVVFPENGLAIHVFQRSFCSGFCALHVFYGR